MGKLFKKQPTLPDFRTFFEAGIDPKTKLPTKMLVGQDFNLRNDTIKLLEVIDRQDYVNRGVWYNLPDNIDSQELERLMYIKGQLAFFYMEETDEFYFMPFALDGGLDFYQRYKTIHPVPMSEMTDDASPEEKAAFKKLRTMLSMVKKDAIYKLVDDETVIERDLIRTGCVILRDYTPGINQTLIPRMILQKPLIEQEADFFCYTRTAGLIALGIKAMRVNDADQESEVDKAAQKYKEMAQKGIPWTGITSTVEFQDLATSTGVKPDEFLMVLQSVDNLRLRALGIDNGGLFQKKAQELEEQAALNDGPIGLEAQDYVTRRQQFCLIANAIFGTTMWYEPSENILMADRNMDGAIYDEKGQMADTSYDNTTDTTTEV